MATKSEGELLEGKVFSSQLKHKPPIRNHYIIIYIYISHDSELITVIINNSPVLRRQF